MLNRNRKSHSFHSKTLRRFWHCKFILLTCTLFVLIFVFMLYIGTFKKDVMAIGNIPRDEKWTQKCPGMCTSKQCLKLAMSTISTFDTKANPCDNFYQYVCGSYPETFYLENKKGNMVSHATSSLSLFHKLLDIVLSSESDDPHSVIYKRRKFYDSCIMFSDVDKGLATIVKQISNVIPNWPDIENSSVTDSDMNFWLSKFYLLDGFAFIKVYVLMDIFREMREFFENLNMTAPPKLQGGTTIEMNFLNFSLLDECAGTNRDAFIGFLINVIERLGISREKSEYIVNVAMKIDDLLKNITLQSQQQRLRENYTYKCNSTDLENDRWCNVMDRLIQITEAKIDLEAATFSLSNRWEFDALDRLLKTERENLAHYLVVRYLLSSLKLFKTVYKAIKLPCKIDKVFQFSVPSADPRLLCLQLITNFVPNMLSKDYIESTRIMEKLEDVQILLEEIKRTIRLYIINSTSITEQQKHKLYRSLSRTQLGTLTYVNFVKNKLASNTLYKNIKFNDNFAHNLMVARKYIHYEDIKSGALNIMKPQSVRNNYFITNALSLEKLFIGFGIFENPIFIIDGPKYILYSRFGQLLGQEISHIFLNILFYNIGMKQRNTSMPNFHNELKKCSADAFYNFVIPELKVPITEGQTTNEDMADILGMHFAFVAYKNYLMKNIGDIKLPGINFTENQLFFISYGQLWCEYGDRDGFARYITNVHRPYEHRINGVLRQYSVFPETFGCLSNSFMNSDEKCISLNSS